MAESKLELKVGAVSFSGEGGEKWLAEQLDKMLQKIPELANVSPAGNTGDSGSGAGSNVEGHGTPPKKHPSRNACGLFESEASYDQSGKKIFSDIDVATRQDGRVEVNDN